VSKVRVQAFGVSIDGYALRPVLLGTGEHLLGGLDLRSLGYECVKQVAGERATHFVLRRRP
jgi:hypothetical protein